MLLNNMQYKAAGQIRRLIIILTSYFQYFYIKSCGYILEESYCLGDSNQLPDHIIHQHIHVFGLLLFEQFHYQTPVMLYD